MKSIYPIKIGEKLEEIDISPSRPVVIFNNVLFDIFLEKEKTEKSDIEKEVKLAIKIIDCIVLIAIKGVNKAIDIIYLNPLTFSDSEEFEEWIKMNIHKLTIFITDSEGKVIDAKGILIPKDVIKDLRVACSISYQKYQNEMLLDMIGEKILHDLGKDENQFDFIY